MIALGDKGYYGARCCSVRCGVCFPVRRGLVAGVQVRRRVAITVIGAILGVSALGIGYVLAMTSNRQALNSAASIYHSAAHADAAKGRRAAGCGKVRQPD